MSLANLQDLYQKMDLKSAIAQVITASPGASTSANAGAGNILYTPHFNTIGSTHWSSLISMPMPQGLTASPLRLLNASLISNRIISGVLVNLYKIGTVNLTTGTGEFTHGAATFPILKTKLGQANQPVNLIPVILFTTASSGTAPQLTMDYVDQDGNNVTGTKTWVAPAAATAIGSMYHLPLEDADQAIRDVTSINVTTPSSTGAATIYGMEIIGSIGMTQITIAGTRDFVHNGLTLRDIRPGVATSGTVDRLFCFAMMNQNLTSQSNLTLRLLYDT